ncbi:hypothetical protein SLE2022_164250 [Rubroshorea leprosula]
MLGLCFNPCITCDSSRRVRFCPIWDSVLGFRSGFVFNANGIEGLWTFNIKEQPFFKYMVKIIALFQNLQFNTEPRSLRLDSFAVNCRIPADEITEDTERSYGRSMKYELT